MIFQTHKPFPRPLILCFLNQFFIAAYLSYNIHINSFLKTFTAPIQIPTFQFFLTYHTNHTYTLLPKPYLKAFAFSEISQFSKLIVLLNQHIYFGKSISKQTFIGFRVSSKFRSSRKNENIVCNKRLQEILQARCRSRLLIVKMGQ